MKRLAIGMACFKDFDTAYLTVQALRTRADFDPTTMELLVVDNAGDDRLRGFCSGAGVRYVRWTEVQGSAPAKGRVFAESQSEWTFCIDPHIILTVPDALSRLVRWIDAHPADDSLLHGPLAYDALTSGADRLTGDTFGGDGVWGQWGGSLPPVDAEPYEIPKMGMGLFGARTSTWLGFAPGLRGFGGEEGIIHAKYLRAGRKVRQLPWMRWCHLFRDKPAPYNPQEADKVRNTLLGFRDAGLDPAPVFLRWGDLARRLYESMHTSTSAPPGVLLSYDMPKVSCICGTYNRVATKPHLLAEAVESFLRQTYPHKELIILNDCPGQEIVCNAPGVRVVNAPSRFPSLGEKFNHAVGLTDGSIICDWNDDDVSLPHRLTQAVEALREHEVFIPGGYWMLDNDGLHSDHPIGYCLNCSAFTREAWKRIGGYPRDVQSIDPAMISAFHAQCKVKPGKLERGDWSYVYRWGVSDFHLSAFYPHMAQAWEDQAKRVTARGRFVVEPRWAQDYVAMTQKCLNSAGVK